MVPPTYPKYHSVTPPFKSIYFHAHRSIPSSTLTTIIQHREYVTVQYLHLCNKLDIASQKFFILPKSRLSHSHSCSYILITSCILCYPATQLFKTSHLLQRHIVQCYTLLHPLRFCQWSCCCSRF